VMENKLRAQAFVSDVSFSYTLPSGANRNRSAADIGKPEASEMKDYVIYEYVAIDSSYLRLYDIDLLAGRNLELSDSIGNILINNTLAKNLELGIPDKAIGRELKMSDGTKVTVVGVVEDYFSNSVKERVDNMVFLMEPENFSAVSIKLNLKEGQGSLQDAINGVEKIWTATFPEYIFNYQFLDENINIFYEQEQKYTKLFQLFSIIFLLIGCLGLYGLITFVVNRKGREVAIRKVLGATLGSILVLFSKEYIQLIILSFLLAVPIAWYLVNDWLNNFANHITLYWWLFALPGLLVLFIAVMVVGIKTLRAAGMNPVDKLKYE
jgi:putative ABC transport system permease protein